MGNEAVKLLSEAIASMSMAYYTYKQPSKEIYDLIGDIQSLLNKFMFEKQAMNYD